MARVVRFGRTGGPEVLTIETETIGDPGPGEVRMRIAAIGLNRAEAMFRAGRYLETPAFPSRLGYEASGIVEAVGDGVTHVKPGDSVGVIPAFSMISYGTYADEAILPAHAVTKSPAGLSPAEATSIWMQYLTAYGALFHFGKLAAGQSVIVTAASSSVGLAALQMIRDAGAIGIAATRGRAKEAAIREAGAHHVIVTDEQDLVAEVQRITGGKGADFAFDPVAGPGVEAIANGMARHGTIFLYGALAQAATPFPLFAALGKGLTLRGYTLFEISGDPATLNAATDWVRGKLEAGAFKPIIAKTFPLDAIVEAHRFMEGNQQIGKIVVTT